MKVILIAILLFYCFAQVRKGVKLVDSVNYPVRGRPADLKEIPYALEHFSFEAGDRLRLAAVLYQPNQGSKGTIIACHYLGGSKYSIYPYIEPLLAHGFTIASFDYPNHGESMECKNHQFLMHNEMEQLCNELKKMGIRGPYGTFGFSMGTISALVHLPEIKAVVTDSGPLLFVKDYFLYVLKHQHVKNIIVKMSFLFIYLYMIGFRKLSRQMGKQLKAMQNVPIMMIHNRKDRIVSYRNVLYAKELLNSDLAEIITVEHGHHLTNRIVLGRKYDELVIGFFEKWLVKDGA